MVRPVRWIKRSALPLLRLFAGIVVLAGLLLSYTAHANPVEENSQDNRLYVLISNPNPGDDFLVSSMTVAMPAFTSAATTVYQPAVVPSFAGRVAAFAFDVDPGVAVGTTGDAVVTVTGTVANLPAIIEMNVPLEVTADAPPAEYVDPLLGMEDVDTDGDGVADWVETLFGTDPMDPASSPLAVVAVPAISKLGVAVLIALMSVLAWMCARRRRVASERGAR